MRLSLRARFALTFSGLIVLSSIVLSLLLGVRASRMAEAQIGAGLSETAFQMAEQLDQVMWSRTQEMLVLASLDAVRRPADLRTARALLNRLQEAIPLYSWIGLLAPDGTVREATGDLLKGMDISQRPVFAKGREGLFIGDVHDAVLLAKRLPNPTGEAMKFVDISVALHDDSGALTGVLAAHLSWAWAKEVEESFLSASKAKNNVEIFVVASDGTVLLGDKALLGTRLDLPMLQHVTQGPGAWAVETWPDGNRHLTGVAFGNGFRDYKGLGWTVVARQPLAVAYASVRGLMRDIFLVGGLLSLLFALGGWFIAKRVIQPLKAITSAADRLRLGQEAAIPEHHDIPEIATLSASLRTLIDSLTKSETALTRMERLATRDPLTGLTNRLGLAEHLATALPRLTREGGSLVLLCLDLDGFKRVNDTLGHQAGDLLLKDVAKRLSGCLRGGDMLVRQGGDEFLMLLEDVGEDSEVQQFAGRIIEAIGKPLLINGSSVGIGVSIGAAAWPRHGTGMEVVLATADAALYKAKRSGKNRLVLAAGNKA